MYIVPTTSWNHKNETWEMTNLLRPLLVNVNFTRNGGSELVFQSTQYAGYVGVLSGMSKSFSVTIDDRFALNGGFMGILDWFKGDRKEKWVSLLTRYVQVFFSFFFSFYKSFSHLTVSIFSFFFSFTPPPPPRYPSQEPS